MPKNSISVQPSQPAITPQNVTSNISSLPEVGGDAALYVDPLSVEDIKEKLELMINDEGLRTEFIKKGHEQAKKFSWEKTARETLSALESIK